MIENATRLIWLAWTTLWFALAFRNKPSARQESWASRARHGVPIAAGAGLMFFHAGGILGWPALDAAILPRAPALTAAGLLPLLAGLAFAIWARATIGRNWSGVVTLKHNHELVQTGPYAVVRHPIYTGLLAALAGTTLVIDAPRALAGLALITYAFLRKIPIEERFMHEAFGPDYETYRLTTPALLPRL